MSILIEGMDMPKICELCPFWVMRSEGRWCRTLHKIIDISKDKADDCPLVEIPTPHGRLIDGDKLIEAHYDYCINNHGEADVFYVWSKKLMDNAPTILEAED